VKCQGKQEQADVPQRRSRAELTDEGERIVPPGSVLPEVRSHCAREATECADAQHMPVADPLALKAAT